MDMTMMALFIIITTFVIMGMVVMDLTIRRAFHDWIGIRPA